LLTAPEYLNIESWIEAVKDSIHACEEGDEGSFFLKANDIGNAAQALIEFLILQHSTGKNLSRKRQEELKVTIQPHSSLKGLFFSKFATFFVCVNPQFSCV
jgi:hypothetical protein